MSIILEWYSQKGFCCILVTTLPPSPPVPPLPLILFLLPPPPLSSSSFSLRLLLPSPSSVSSSYSSCCCTFSSSPSPPLLLLILPSLRIIVTHTKVLVHIPRDLLQIYIGVFCTVYAWRRSLGTETLQNDYCCLHRRLLKFAYMNFFLTYKYHSLLFKRTVVWELD